MVNDDHKCKEDCIDKDLNFCPNTDFTSGNCCEGDDCRNGFVCSSDSPKAPHSFKYFTCPNNEVCGDRSIKVSGKHRGDNRIQRSVEKIQVNDLCSYKIETDGSVSKNDVIYLTVSDIENSEVWVS